jgi:hypothetical protein
VRRLVRDDPSRVEAMREEVARVYQSVFSSMDRQLEALMRLLELRKHRGQLVRPRRVEREEDLYSI